MRSGFTLIETLLYLAIVVMLMTAGFISAYAILDTSGRGSRNIIVASEGNFLIRKIDWALSGATAVSVPSPSRIDITKNSTIYTFEIVGGKMKLTPPDVDLSSSNVTVSGTVGKAFGAECISGKPKRVDVALTVDNSQFSITRYLRAGTLCP